MEYDQYKKTICDYIVRNIASLKRGANDRNTKLIELTNIINSQPHKMRFWTDREVRIESLLENEDLLKDSSHCFAYDLYPKINNYEIDIARFEVILLVRKHWWPGERATRLHEVGPRISRAFAIGGIRCTTLFYEDYSLLSDILDYVKLINLSKEKSIVMVDFDCDPIMTPDKRGPWFIQGLRDNFQYVVLFFLDYWRTRRQSRLLNLSTSLSDAIWIPSTSPHTDDPTNTFYFPLPLGLTPVEYNLIRSSQVMSKGAATYGSIEETNFPRAFWLEALSDINSYNFYPSWDQEFADPHSDYISYLLRLRSDAAVVNFSERDGGSFVATGRAIEAIAIGVPLIQEIFEGYSRYFFRPDLHYSMFSSIEDLRTLLDQEFNLPRAQFAMNLYDNLYSETAFCRHFIRFLCSR